MQNSIDSWERIPTYAWNKAFTHIPEHVRQDVETLEREGAIYANLWIEEVRDFRHVRIEFTTDEREEFLRRSWAYELFLRANRPTWAIETPGIDDDIAEEADKYSLHLRDGTVIRPPYHCFAAFLGNHLEQLHNSGKDRRTVIELSGREKILFEVKRAIDTLTPTTRSFNRREKGLAPWNVTCEDDVRDLLYVMLRPILFDITKEEVVPSRAGSSKVADLCSQSGRLLIELKWISRSNSWRRKIDEIHIDTQSYVMHPACDNLLFVIVDSIKDIPDPRQIEQDLTGTQVIEGREIKIRVVVCDT